MNTTETSEQFTGPDLPPGFPTSWSQITFGQFIELDKLDKDSVVDPAMFMAILYASVVFDEDGNCGLDIGTLDESTSLLTMFTSLCSSGQAREIAVAAVGFLKKPHGYHTAPALTQITLEGKTLPVPPSGRLLSHEIRRAFAEKFGNVSQAQLMFDALFLSLREFNRYSIPDAEEQLFRAALLRAPLYYVYSTGLHLLKTILNSTHAL